MGSILVYALFPILYTQKMINKYIKNRIGQGKEWEKNLLESGISGGVCGRVFGEESWNVWAGQNSKWSINDVEDSVAYSIVAWNYIWDQAKRRIARDSEGNV